jgi:hypothetical protein
MSSTPTPPPPPAAGKRARAAVHRHRALGRPDPAVCRPAHRGTFF